MSAFVAFVIGFIIGGMTGVFLLAVVVACKGGDGE